jgi:undecaprenyl-diphosphatase UppP
VNLQTCRSKWNIQPLGQAVEILDSRRVPVNSEERKKRVGKTPYYGATGQVGWIDDYLFDEELVLLGEDGVPFLDRVRQKAYLISGKSWVNNHAHVFRPLLVSGQYLVHWLNSFDYSGRVAGATRAKLNQSRAVDIPIALPPLAEQRRIVSKVSGLMALCDDLVAVRAKREAGRDDLTESVMHRLAPVVEDMDLNAPEALREGAAFAVEMLGAILFVVVLYWKRFWNWEVLKKLVVAFIPTGLIGVALYKVVKHLLGDVSVVLWTLLLGGIALILFERFKDHSNADPDFNEITYRKALLVGLFQAIAIVPGVSRSAATIVGGSMIGISKRTIVEFSFMLAVPTMLAASLLELLKGYSALAGHFSILAIGFVVSFVTAIIAIKSFLAYLKRRDFTVFGWYRIVLAVAFYLVVLR